jgi:Fe2+ transport system protein A
MSLAVINGQEHALKRRKMKMTLREAAVGQTVKVQRLTGTGPVKRRIMDMGITKGIDVYVRKVAPLGDPVEVTVRGYELSLRKADAAMIEVG